MMNFVITNQESVYNEFDNTLVCSDIAYKVEMDGTEIGEFQIGLFYDEDGNVNVAYVANIEVYEQYRNNGYGTEILRTLSSEYGYIYLCAENECAERLYQRIGEEIEDYDRVPECIMGNYDEWGNMYRI